MSGIFWYLSLDEGSEWKADSTQCEKHSKKEEALEKLKGGAKFDEVAKEFSEDKARAGTFAPGEMAAVMFTNVRNQVGLWDGKREATWILHLKKRLSSSKLVHWQVQSTWRSRQDSDIIS
jgi:hypothetical protein